VAVGKFVFWPLPLRKHKTHIYTPSVSGIWSVHCCPPGPLSGEKNVFQPEAKAGGENFIATEQKPGHFILGIYHFSRYARLFYVYYKVVLGKSRAEEQLFILYILFFICRGDS